MVERRRIPVALRQSPARWLQESPSALVPLSVTTGLITGLGAILFRWLITTATHAFTGYDDYAGRGRIPSTHFPWLGVWFLVLTPMVAGALYGPLVNRFAPEARGHGVPEVMYAVAERGGRIAPRVTVIKALAAALCIGGGGSVGREGPIVQIGSATGSTIAQALRLGTPRLRLLVACGAAGGIAATFNAPLAGVFFAMELILRDFAAEAFGAVVLASVTASAIGRAAFGSSTFLSLPPFTVRSPWDYLLYAAVGVVLGVVGVAFSATLYKIEDLCDWAWRWREWARPAVGGLVLGLLLLALPQMYGVGYPILQDATTGEYAVGMLVILMIGKIIATSLTIGIGGSGGVFAPTLFIGATGGAACGQIIGHLLPSVAGPVGSYALIGMAAAVGASTRAPITAVMILFELTGEYSIILPLMASVAIATGVANLLSHDSIYTRKLTRRGVTLDRPAALLNLNATDIARTVPTPLRETDTLPTAVAALTASALGMLPVVDDQAGYCGCITAQDVAEALASTEPPGTLHSLLTLPPTVAPHTGAAEVVTALSRYNAPAVPVIDNTRSELVGWITYGDLMSALTHDGRPL